MTDLYLELLRAHDRAATTMPNGSLQVAEMVYKASGNMTAALAAASLAQGDLHAPIDAAREVLTDGVPDNDNWQDLAPYWGPPIPGFGNSFYPDGDPAFAEVERLLREQRPDLCSIVDGIRERFPKLPPPNAAMWTAMVMEATDMPVGMGAAVFISARVKAWCRYLLFGPSSADDEARAAQKAAQEATEAMQDWKVSLEQPPE